MKSWVLQTDLKNSETNAFLELCCQLFLLSTGEKFVLEVLLYMFETPLQNTLFGEVCINIYNIFFFNLLAEIGLECYHLY
jgi:hypothetical protein